MTIPHVLATNPVDPVDVLVTPEAVSSVTLNSSALEIFTDFKRHQPLIIDGSASVEEAEELMRRTHVKLKLVVDPAGAFVGTVSHRDLSGPRFRQLLGQGTPKSEITVKQVMTPRDELQAISYQQMARASVADIVESLKAEHCQHFLVIDRTEHQIRGIFSASDIARRLHISIDISASPMFADICHVVSRHVHGTH